MKYVFKSAALLEVALTHTSHAYENGGQHNERLEFLGDAALKCFAVCAAISNAGASRARC